MNTDIHNAATQYVGILNDKYLVCHTGVLQAAMKKGVKRVHRLVTKPEYQGIGIGLKFLNFIAEQYESQGLGFNIITTTPALKYALDRCPLWTLRRSGHVQPPGKTKLILDKYKHLQKTFSCTRITYSYDYKKTDTE